MTEVRDWRLAGMGVVGLLVKMKECVGRFNNAYRYRRGVGGKITYVL